MLFFDTAQAQSEKKIVWRLSDTGKPDFQAKNETGATTSPIWGPESHGSSNWERPGEEWGTGFNFPAPGCWTIIVTQGETVGEIRLNVLAP